MGGRPVLGGTCGGPYNAKSRLVDPLFPLSARCAATLDPDMWPAS